MREREREREYDGVCVVMHFHRGKRCRQMAFGVMMMMGSIVLGDRQLKVVLVRGSLRRYLCIRYASIRLLHEGT